MKYVPKPIDTSSAVLPEEYIELAEVLAKNIHETWAKKRLSEGWKYGLQRNDQKKEHPCLLPYEGLPEEEKEYDRITALEILKAIIVLGYSIEKV